MLCPQSGKNHTVKIGKLSREDGDPLTNDDLFKGSVLILDYKGKSYPVEFMEFVDGKNVFLSHCNYTILILILSTH